MYPSTKRIRTQLIGDSLEVVLTTCNIEIYQSGNFPVEFSWRENRLDVVGSYKRMSQIHVNYMYYKSWLGYTSVTRYGSGSAPPDIPTFLIPVWRNFTPCLIRRDLGYYGVMNCTVAGFESQPVIRAIYGQQTSYLVTSPVSPDGNSKENQKNKSLLEYCVSNHWRREFLQ